MLKHCDRDMRSWKMARSKLAALLPEDVLNEAVEKRRQEIMSDFANGKENKDSDSDEESLCEHIFEENEEEDDFLPEDPDDASIWKHPGELKRRKRFRDTLNGKLGEVTPLKVVFCCKIFADTIDTFLWEMGHRLSSQVQVNGREEKIRVEDDVEVEEGSQQFNINTNET